MRRSAVLRAILSLDDAERLAARILPPPLHQFVAGGAEDGWSVRANRDAFAQWALLPRVLVDTTGRDQATTLFGQRWAAPFGISPMGAAALAAYDADRVMARAAAAAGIPFILSGAALTPMAEVLPAHPGAWYQAYVPSDRQRIGALLDRVARAGFATLVVTVDVPVSANREHYLRTGFNLPVRPSPRLAWQGITHPRWLGGTVLRTLIRRGMPRFEAVGAGPGVPIVSRSLARDLGRRDALDWNDIAWIRDRWRGPFILKGVLSPEDARLARRAGLDGIVVSNHGGRQLDSAIAPLQILPAVLAEAGDMVVMLESGLRRGTDILKALALGARFVFIGRPFLFAAALAGTEGVGRVIALLKEEIDRDMGLLGCTSPAALSRHSLVPAWSPNLSMMRTNGDLQPASG